MIIILEEHLLGEYILQRLSMSSDYMLLKLFKVYVHFHSYNMIIILEEPLTTVGIQYIAMISCIKKTVISGSKLSGMLSIYPL